MSRPGPFSCLLAVAVLFSIHARADDAVAERAAAKKRELTAGEEEANTTKGAGGTHEEPEPDYLALADAPLFLPRNYLYWGTPAGPEGHRESLVFGLEYALHLPVYSNLRDNVLIGKHWAGAVTLSFEGMLRMLANDSKPVRMPSYRPNLSGQVFYTFFQPAPVIVSLRVSAFHYSNGQERCTFDERESSESAACQASIGQVSRPAEQLNRVNGDFSMNGWLTELHGRVHHVNDKGVAIAHLAAGASLSGYLRRGPGAMEPPLRALYGKFRLELDLEGKQRMGWAGITVRGAYLTYPKSGPSIPQHAGRAEVVIDPYWLTGLGLFVRYYGGRDSYNAFFVDRLQQLSVGVAWDGERPLKFKRD